MKEPQLFDWTGVEGPDDFVAKSESENSEWENLKTKEVIGNPKNKNTNAGRIQELTELMIEKPGEYTQVLDFLPMLENRYFARDPEIPKERYARERALIINGEAFNFLHEYFGSKDAEMKCEVKQDTFGYTRIITTTPTKNGFSFSEEKIYFPGHDPEIDPIPDNFYAQVSSLGYAPISSVGGPRTLPPNWA